VSPGTAPRLLAQSVTVRTLLVYITALEFVMLEARSAHCAQ